MLNVRKTVLGQSRECLQRMVLCLRSEGMYVYCILKYLDSYVNIFFFRGCVSPHLIFFSIYLVVSTFGCAGSSLLHTASSSCREPGLLFVAVHRLLMVLASPVVEHRL